MCNDGHNETKCGKVNMKSQSIYSVISRESIFLIIKDTGYFVKVGLKSYKILNKATLQYTFIVHRAAQKFSGQHNVQSTDNAILVWFF